MYLVTKKNRKKSDSLSYPFISQNHMYQSFIHSFIRLCIWSHVVNLAQRLRHNDFLVINSIVQAELYKGGLKLRMRLWVINGLGPLVPKRVWDSKPTQGGRSWVIKLYNSINNSTALLGFPELPYIIYAVQQMSLLLYTYLYTSALQ